jgi:hypothetical protein
VGQGRLDGKAQWRPVLAEVFGKGNKPLGIKDLISLLRIENTAILNRHWFLYDFRDNVEDYESGKADLGDQRTRVDESMIIESMFLTRQ